MRERLHAADIVWRYSLLFAPRRFQLSLSSVFVFYLELEDIFFRSADPTLVEPRLAWWQQELDAAIGGTATHPVTRSLSQRDVLFEMRAALNHDETGGRLFNATQLLGGYPTSKDVFELGQAWFRLRSARLDAESDIEQADTLSGGPSVECLTRPLAALVDNTLRFDIDAAGFRPLLSAWRAARRSNP